MNFSLCPPHPLFLRHQASGEACEAARRELCDPDAAVVARVRAGEAAAFGLLLGRHRERVLNLAFSLLGSRADAEDAAQEAFVRAYQSLAHFRGEALFSTWLYRVAVNVCLARLRNRRPQVLEEHDAPQVLEGAEEERGALAGDPSRLVESRAQVQATLARLSPRLRAALVLREMHGLSYDEIALALQIPPGTVRSRLSEARRLFRVAWDEIERAEAGGFA